MSHKVHKAYVWIKSPGQNLINELWFDLLKIKYFVGFYFRFLMESLQKKIRQDQKCIEIIRLNLYLDVA